MQWYKTCFKYLSFLMHIKKNNFISIPSIFTSVDSMLSLRYFLNFCYGNEANIRIRISFSNWREMREKTDIEVWGFFSSKLPDTSHCLLHNLWASCVADQDGCEQPLLEGAMPSLLHWIMKVFFSEGKIFLGWGEMLSSRMMSQTMLLRRVKGGSLGCLKSLKRLYLVLQTAGY